MKRIPRFGCLGLVVAGLASCAPATQPGWHDPHAEVSARAQSSRPLRVLFVGNSYCYGAPAAFAKLARQLGHPVVVDQQSFSGWTLARHARNPATLAKISTGNWDIVVLQEQSIIPSRPAIIRIAAMTAPLNILTKKAREAGAIPVLYQSWGRRDGDPKLPGDSFNAMNHRIRVGYQAAAREAGGLLVVPVGQAWEREVMAGHAAKIYNADGSHPSMAGNQLIARTFYQTFFGTNHTKR